MASTVDTSVKFYNEGMPGAPVLNGVAGALVALIKACLVTGFGIRTPTSIVVVGGVATVTTANEPKNLAMIDSVIAVSGITGALTALNGEQKITGATATTLTFATAAANGTAAGTLSIRTAPAGWEETYSTTNVSCFRSLDPTSLGAFLRLDDTATLYAQPRMYETMSGHSTGTNQAPLVAEVASLRWSKSLVANSTANPWDLFADSRIFYYCPVAGVVSTPTTQSTAVLPFGDIIPFKSVDPFATWLSGASSELQANYGSALTAQQAGASSGPSRLLRSYTGLGVAIQSYGTPMSGNQSSATSGVDPYFGSFPSVDGKVRLSRVQVGEGAAPPAALYIPRGTFPGLFYAPTTGGGPMFQRGSTLTVDGRTLVSVRQGSGGFAEAQSTSGFGFVDRTGPWR